MCEAYWKAPPRMHREAFQWSRDGDYCAAMPGQRHIKAPALDAVDGVDHVEVSEHASCSSKSLDGTCQSTRHRLQFFGLRLSLCFGDPPLLACSGRRQFARRVGAMHTALISLCSHSASSAHVTVPSDRRAGGGGGVCGTTALSLLSSHGDTLSCTHFLEGLCVSRRVRCE